MASAVAELEAGLQAMLSLKPPGVSRSRIQSITSLCVTNIQSESVLIQKLYTHFKKTPGIHKLGVLYVVDSVTRKWTEQAKSAGQPINSAAEDGTFAAGVHRVKELLPVLMNDIIQSAPDDQKEKINKLVDIWEKGQTFPLQMLTAFKEKLNAPSQNQSTTPPGSPPPDIRRISGLSPLAAPLQAPSVSSASNTSSILAALANMARQNTSAAPANSKAQHPDSSFQVPNGQNNSVQQPPALNQQQNLQFPPIPPPVNVPPPAGAFAPQVQAQNQGAQNFPSNSIPYAGVPSVVPPTALNPVVQQQLLVIKTLTDQGIPADKIPGILAALGSQGLATLGGGGFPPVAPPQFQNQNQNVQNAQNGWGARQPDESRDRDRNGPETIRSPNGYRGRSRSRSPQGRWNARDSPPNHRRDGPNFDYERDSPGRTRGGGRARGNDYRQRSPPRRGRSPSPTRMHGGGEKWVGHDNSIGSNNIKVLSRTLFVGGVTCSDQELRKIFARFGNVQTCIVNKDKRHAFVKMISRKDAVAAKDAMEKNRSPDSSLRTRWGVGFGPRDCSDYQTGVSIIPIGKLTDADRKWMLNADFGGSGGKPIEAGMVVEEPDIEIGQGVSSKAISRRMQTDKGGNYGPKSGRDREEDEQPSRYRRGSDEERRDRRRGDDHSGPPAMPSIPQFQMPPGFPSFTLPNGMPMIPPPGFPSFLAQAQAQTQQPPPPGHRT